jgi:hypothetical protein
VNASGESRFGSDPGRFEQPPQREGLSVGAKIGIGCGVLVLLVLIAIGTMLFYVQRTFEREAGGARAQREATATIERLAEEYPFTRPVDGVVRADQAQKFISVTDEVWPEIEPWINEMNEYFEEPGAAEDRSALKFLAKSVRSAGKLMRVRVVLAESLERHQVSSEEYAWVGTALLEAYRARTDSMEADVPEPNLELAGTYEAELASIESQDQILGKGMIIIMAGIDTEKKSFWELLGEEMFF